MLEYNSNPNQKRICVNKATCNDYSTSNYYAKINLIALKNAMSSLSPKAFELWIYFSKNRDKHNFYLSKVDFLNWSNISSSSYYTAFKELVEKKYLIAIDSNNIEPKNYNFFEIPQEHIETEINSAEIDIYNVNHYENEPTFRIGEFRF